MKRIKVSEVSGATLDWLVAKAEGRDFKYMQDHGGDYNGWTTGPHYRNYSTDPVLSQPILERERISTTFHGVFYGEHWWATRGDPTDEETTGYVGPTMLIAGMRCYVASKLGNEVEVPEELT